MSLTKHITDTDIPFEVCISKEELAALPLAPYRGQAVIIDTPEAAAEALHVLAEAPIIGFDTETRPNFSKGQQNRVSLMQLAVHGTCYLFRINILGLTDGLLSLLQDPDKLKVGLSIHDDFMNLRRLRLFEPQGFIELQKYVKDFKISDASLQKIYAILFGERISKGQRLSNWEAAALSPHQMSYAALDADACIRIYEYISSGKFNPLVSPYRHIITPEITE